MRFLKLVSAFLLAILLVLPAGSNVSAAEEKVINITPEEYNHYLLDLSKTEPEALVFLEKFNDLKDEEQVAFLEFLYSDEYFNTTIETDFKYTASNNVEVPVSTKSTINDDAVLNLNSIQPMANYRTWATATIEFAVFGLTTTQITTMLTWLANETRALEIYSVTQGHTNFNPAVVVTRNGAQPNGISNGKAHGISTFTLKAAATAGFWQHSLSHEIRGATLNNKQHKMNTGHPSITNFNWRNF